MILDVPAFSVSVKTPVAEAAWVMAPVSVILPLAVRLRLPVPTEEAPRLKAEPLTRETLLLPELLRETAPVKALLWVRVMPKPPVVKLEVPGTVKIPDCVMAPPALIVRFWPIEEA